MTDHGYRVRAEWTGNDGTGTSGYRDYRRDVTLHVDGKPSLLASADRPFRGDPARWNPEDLLLSSLTECHLLSYLHAAVTRGVVVVSYVDDAVATMVQEGSGGRFTEAVLRPVVTITAESDPAAAAAAHHDAHEWCFIASSVNFPVRVEPTILQAP